MVIVREQIRKSHPVPAEGFKRFVIPDMIGKLYDFESRSSYKICA